MEWNRGRSPAPSFAGFHPTAGADLEFSNNGSFTRLTAAVSLHRPLDEVFAFFSNCHNLQRLTPDSLRFQVLTPEAEKMRVGLLIDYRLSLHGIPFQWQSEITVWEPPFRFVDEQRKGPYRDWIHEHRFEEHDGGTRVTDTVDYRVPGGSVVERLIVRGQVRDIFNYRTERLQAALG